MYRTLRTTVAAALTMAIMTLRAQAGDVSYGYEAVDGVEVFYRVAGDPANPAIALWHGFPSSSQQDRQLLDDLSDD